MRRSVVARSRMGMWVPRPWPRSAEHLSAVRLSPVLFIPTFGRMPGLRLRCRVLKGRVSHRSSRSGTSPISTARRLRASSVFCVDNEICLHNCQADNRSDATIVCAGNHNRQTSIWRRQSVSPVAKGCEPGQVRKEAAVASESGAGVGQAGAVSIVSDQNLATRNRLNRIITPALLL